MWYIGIDWADDQHDTAVVDESGHQVAKIRVPHSAEGLRQLTAFLLDVATRASAAGSAPDLEQIAGVVETNHGLLITALLEAGFPVYPVNPKTLERRRTPAGAKTDAIDAYLLAKKARSDLVDLRRGAHCNPRLQEAFRRDGAAALHFAVLTVVTHASDLLEREADFIAALLPAYNHRPVVAGSGLTEAGSATVPAKTVLPARSADARDATRAPAAPVSAATAPLQVVTPPTPEALRRQPPRRQHVRHEATVTATAPNQPQHGWQNAGQQPPIRWDARQRRRTPKAEDAVLLAERRSHPRAGQTDPGGASAIRGAPAVLAALAPRATPPTEEIAGTAHGSGHGSGRGVLGGPPHYPAAVRTQALRLVQAGEQSAGEIARMLGISRETLRRWRKHR